MHLKHHALYPRLKWRSKLFRNFKVTDDDNKDESDYHHVIHYTSFVEKERKDNIKYLMSHVDMTDNVVYDRIMKCYMTWINESFTTMIIRLIFLLFMDILQNTSVAWSFAGELSL